METKGSGGGRIEQAGLERGDLSGWDLVVVREVGVYVWIGVVVRRVEESEV